MSFNGRKLRPRDLTAAQLAETLRRVQARREWFDRLSDRLADLDHARSNCDIARAAFDSARILSKLERALREALDRTRPGGTPTSPLPERG